MQSKTLKADKIGITKAVSLLKQGELVAFPTETVYGLGARVFDDIAIGKIFEAKGRPQDNPLIVHISSLDMVELIAQEIPKEFYLLAEQFFPGPLTIVLKKSDRVSSKVSGGHSSIAFRMPNHPVALALIEALGEPIAAPSANLSGKPSATCAEDVYEDFSDRIPAILDGGQCQIGLESTVLSLINPLEPTLLRPGSITEKEIEQVLQRKVLFHTTGAALSPGMKYRHYAPQARIRLFDTKDSLLSHKNGTQKKCLILCYEKSSVTVNYSITFNSSHIYSLFRQADRMGFDEILILCDEAITSDLALHNRLCKASASI